MSERSNFNFKVYFQNILNKEPCGNFHSMMEYTCKETFDRKKNPGTDGKNIFNMNEM